MRTLFSLFNVKNLCKKPALPAQNHPSFSRKHSSQCLKVSKKVSSQVQEANLYCILLYKVIWARKIVTVFHTKIREKPEFLVTFEQVVKTKMDEFSLEK